MQNQELQKNMSLKTYISILKYFKSQNINEVRILGWEPLLFKDIQRFLLLAEKWDFDITIFSNINIPTSALKNIFSNLSNKRIKINCNINHGDFYSSQEKERIQKNITLLQSYWIQLIIGYNMCNYMYPQWPLELAIKNKVLILNLKITNTALGENIIIDNSERKLGKFIYSIVLDNHKKVFFSISCWLNKDIFTEKERIFMKNKAKIQLRYGCDANDGKFDINTDGMIFKCYPLQELFKQKKIHIINLLNKNIPFQKLTAMVSRWLITTWECTAHHYKS